ncbi:vacuolar protein-sorting-associated protein 25-like [Anneissia japonica]|uniref:vacuolar protein-sorting-associated protein 25-like n=1 Tax=Anneissia japonica TaxID=1529436 RepID=UPI0014255354|nr:vacuolar protein-sorting-associated protein 25-like [Anneissia japonica]
MGNFEWPWQYNFPPFFTLQPNLETRKKQVDGWCDLVLLFAQHHKLYQLDVKESSSNPPFSNPQINRKLPLEGVYTVLEELRTRGNIEWTDKGKSRCLVMWRTPAEWGNLMYTWALKNGLLNTVCTLFEITQGDDSKSEDFHGIEDWLLKRSLELLQKDRKAELISFDGNEGVKFF